MIVEAIAMDRSPWFNAGDTVGSCEMQRLAIHWCPFFSFLSKPKIIEIEYIIDAHRLQKHDATPRCHLPRQTAHSAAEQGKMHPKEARMISPRKRVETQPCHSMLCITPFGKTDLKHQAGCKRKTFEERHHSIGTSAELQPVLSVGRASSHQRPQVA